MAENKAEQLASALLDHFDAATPEELVKWLGELVLMREGDSRAEKFYHSTFKAAVERLYLKTLPGKW